MHAHEMPTHLEVADKLVFGLAARQAVMLGLGLCLGYVLYQQTHLHLPGGGLWVPPLALRIAAGALAAGLGALLAFWQPLGRPLEAWALVLGRYALLPKHYRWQPLPPTEVPALATLTALAHELTGPPAEEVVPAAAARFSRSTYEEVFAGE